MMSSQSQGGGGDDAFEQSISTIHKRVVQLEPGDEIDVNTHHAALTVTESRMDEVPYEDVTKSIVAEAIAEGPQGDYRVRVYEMGATGERDADVAAVDGDQHKRKRLRYINVRDDDDSETEWAAVEERVVGKTPPDESLDDDRWTVSTMCSRFKQSFGSDPEELTCAGTGETFPADEKHIQVTATIDRDPSTATPLSFEAKEYHFRNLDAVRRWFQTGGEHTPSSK
jgi:hypothetical protein